MNGRLNCSRRLWFYTLTQANHETIPGSWIVSTAVHSPHFAGKLLQAIPSFFSSFCGNRFAKCFGVVVKTRKGSPFPQRWAFLWINLLLVGPADRSKKQNALNLLARFFAPPWLAMMQHFCRKTWDSDQTCDTRRWKYFNFTLIWLFDNAFSAGLSLASGLIWPAGR